MSALRDRIDKVDHVAIVVPDMAAALPLFHDTLGGAFVAGGDNDQTGIRLIHLMLPGFKLELMAPLREDSIVSRHLEQRGPGLHHITFFVDDVLKTVDALEGAGFATTGTDVGSSNWSETFLRPSETFGALLQFVATSREWNVPTTEYTLEDVLEGRVVWRDFVACLR
jgi:methylmalonyl-CoA/ethylmalonyl-CoA epimerase